MHFIHESVLPYPPFIAQVHKSSRAVKQTLAATDLQPGDDGAAADDSDSAAYVTPRRRITATAYFETRTLFGRVYWYILAPFHGYIFKDLVTQLERRA